MSQTRIGKSFPEHLITSNIGGLAEASDIAYEVEIQTDGDGEQKVVMTKSVQSKIQELENSGSANINSIIYEQASGSEGTEGYIPAKTLKSKLDDLQNSIQDNQNSINTLQATDVSFTPSGGSQTTVGAYLGNLSESVTEVNRQHSEVSEWHDELSDAVEKLDNINTIAENLKGSIDLNAQIIIVPQSEYQDTTAIPNTIYLCYD